MSKPKGKVGNRMVQVRVWLPEPVKNQAIITGSQLGFDALGVYLRHLVCAAVANDAQRLPRTHLRLRPHVHIYNRQGSKGRFVPLIESAGNERVWVLAVGPTLPKSLGGGICYLADVTRGDEEDGVEGRGVFVRQVDCF